MATRGESIREDKVEPLFPVVLVPGIGDVMIIELSRGIHPSTRLKGVRPGRLLRYTVVVSPVLCHHTCVASLLWGCSHIEFGVRIL